MRHYFVNDCKSFWVWNRAYLWRRYFARRFKHNRHRRIPDIRLCLIVRCLDLKMAQLKLDLVYFVFSLDDVLVVFRAQLGCLSWWSIGGGGALADDIYNSLAALRCSRCCRSQKPSNYLHDKRSRTLTRLAGVKWKVGSDRWCGVGRPRYWSAGEGWSHPTTPCPPQPLAKPRAAAHTQIAFEKLSFLRNCSARFRYDCLSLVSRVGENQPKWNFLIKVEGVLDKFGSVAK